MDWGQQLLNLESCWCSDPMQFWAELELCQLELHPERVQELRDLLERCLLQHSQEAVTEAGSQATIHLLECILRHDYDAKLYFILQSFKGHPNWNVANTAASSCKEVEELRRPSKNMDFDALLSYAQGLTGGQLAGKWSPPEG